MTESLQPATPLGPNRRSNLQTKRHSPHRETRTPAQTNPGTRSGTSKFRDSHNKTRTKLAPHRE
ncbi:Hypothetical predicted protein, partial [Pelobates cultripes]